MKKTALDERKELFLAFLKNENFPERIIKAFSRVDILMFIDRMFHDKVYTETKVNIGSGETSDNIFVLARMIKYIDPQQNERVLEIGTGSGFSTAVLSLLCKEVYTVEQHESLAKAAKKKLYNTGFENIRFFCGDGTDIENDAYNNLNSAIVHAACRKRPMTVIQNLPEKGKIVYPMGPIHQQQIILIKKETNYRTKESHTTSFHEMGEFSLIKGIYGYDNFDPFELVVNTSEEEENE